MILPLFLSPLPPLPPHTFLSPIVSLLQSYELTYRHTYFQSVAIATILKTAAQWYVSCIILHLNFLSLFSYNLSVSVQGDMYTTWEWGH